jgi:hypothetical protein
MNSIKKYFVATGLVAGLAALLVLLNVFSFVEPTNAQNKNETRQWETLVVRGGSLPEGLQGVMNIKGEEGWEPVQVIQSKDGNYVAFLKRRK